MTTYNSRGVLNSIWPASKEYVITSAIHRRSMGTSLTSVLLSSIEGIVVRGIVFSPLIVLSIVKA
ncbi:MAG: hypothetical protein ACRD5J_08100 [Nitrososphaeraceae archaeon]